jgi:Domain of unknown function (DUF4129)
VRSTFRVWFVWLLSVGGLALVVAASAAHPLARGVGRDQAALALLIVAAAAAAPVAFVRVWRRRRVVASVLIVLALLVLLALVLPISPSGLWSSSSGEGTGTEVPTNRVVPRPPDSAPHVARDPFHWVVSPWVAGTLLAVFAFVIVTALALIMRRSRAEARDLPAPAPVPDGDEPEVTAEELYSLLGDTLDDLRTEPDARTAVIAAYFRMEQGLAEFGLVRRPSEAPFEYLARALHRLSVSARAARRLTDLFERAKFGGAAVDAAMKDEAIEALEAIREEVGAWAVAR